jgi:cytochrome oxidase Cu insertion factor (SCO1/SenC/PrrC family)
MSWLWVRPALLLALVGVFAGLAWMAGPSAAQDKDDGTTLKVKEGQPAPNVELPATQVGTVRLKDYQGKKHVVLYFFPKALTAG